jgi:hypothetical protein
MCRKQSLVHKEQSSIKITSREEAYRIQMCRKPGFSAQGTVKHGNNQHGVSIQGTNVQGTGVQCTRNSQA